MPETRRAAAERLARNFNRAYKGSYVPSAYHEAVDAIEAALKARDERAADIL